MNDESPVVVRLLRGFGRFWWDFLIGDTPELFLAALAIIGLVALLSELWRLNVLSIVVLPIAVLLALSWSLARALRGARRD